MDSYLKYRAEGRRPKAALPQTNSRYRLLSSVGVLALLFVAHFPTHFTSKYMGPHLGKNAPHTQLLSYNSRRNSLLYLPDASNHILREIKKHTQYAQNET